MDTKSLMRTFVQCAFPIVVVSPIYFTPFYAISVWKCVERHGILWLIFLKMLCSRLSIGFGKI